MMIGKRSCYYLRIALLVIACSFVTGRFVIQADGQSEQVDRPRRVNPEATKSSPTGTNQSQDTKPKPQSTPSNPTTNQTAKPAEPQQPPKPGVQGQKTPP